MTAMLASGVHQQQAALGEGGRGIVGVDHSPGGLLPGQVSVIAARLPSQDPAGPASAAPTT